jgi:hypothetical protein
VNGTPVVIEQRLKRGKGHWMGNARRVRFREIAGPTKP